MFGEWIPILLFYGLVIGVTITIGLFVSINIPLLVFDKSIQLFNFLTGSNFLNQKLSPNEIKQLDYLLNDLGGLSDYEKEYLITANKGQGILFLENIRTRIQVVKNI